MGEKELFEFAMPDEQPEQKDFTPIRKDIPMFFTEEELNSFRLSSKCLGISFVLVMMSKISSETEDDDLYITFEYPSMLDPLMNAGIFEDVRRSEVNKRKMSRTSIRLFRGHELQYMAFTDILNGPVRAINSLYIFYYMIIAYILMRDKKFTSYMKKLQEHEEKIQARFKECFPDTHLLSQKNRFYALVQSKDRDDLLDTAMDVAEIVRMKSKLMPGLKAMSLLTFAEQFTVGMNDGGNDNFGVKYFEPEPNIIYVLNDISTFLAMFNKRIEHNSVYNRARSVQAVARFFEQMKDEYYIILCGSKEEIDSFLALNPALPLLFTDERLNVPDYTVNDMTDILCEKNNAIEKDKLMPYLEKHMEDFPVHNDKLIRFLDNHYSMYGTLPKDKYLRKNNFRDELDSMIGIQPIKDQIYRIYNLLCFMKKNKDVEFPKLNLHMLFKGNPGTGKTTVARIIADALYDCGACRERRLVEVHCPDLVAGYVGQTALKTRRMIEKALGGVLFVDEAYALTQSRGDFGMEALAVIIKMMEDHRDDLVVIFAGYSDEMQTFIEANPGLASRIGYTFDFKDYSKAELLRIFDKKMKGFKVNDKARRKIGKAIEAGMTDRNFGNGRFIDKLVQDVLMEHAQHNYTLDITEKDIPAVKQNGSRKSEIGFHM